MGFILARGFGGFRGLGFRVKGRVRVKGGVLGLGCLGFYVPPSVKSTGRFILQKELELEVQGLGSRWNGPVDWWLLSPMILQVLV